MNQPFNYQPQLQNEMVLLRPMRQSDFEHLYKIGQNPKIWEQHQNPDRGLFENFQVFFNEGMDMNTAFVILDQKTQNIIGSSRYKMVSETHKAIEIGWTFLDPRFWGGRYNQSFKKLMIDHAFTYFDYVIFNIDQNNIRSQKAVQKLGGILISKEGHLAHLHTTKTTGLTFIIAKESW